MNKTKILLFFLIFFISITPAFCYVEDVFANSTLLDVTEKPYVNDNYNYNDTTVVKIKLSVVERIKTENDLWEGQTIALKIAQDVVYNGKIIAKKGDVSSATVETIIANGMNGIPASVILGNFKIKNLETHKLSVEYDKYGFDLSWLVFPVKWALTPFPPTGSLTNFIKGGHVSFSPKRAFTIYYHPNWN